MTQLEDNNMNELEKLLQAIDKLATRPLIPISVDLWGPSEIASYLKIGRRTASEKVTKKPGFPQAIYIPSQKGRGHPRWKAKEVIAWVEKFQDKRIA